MTPPADVELVSLAVAAKRLGRHDRHGAQWLRRELLAREHRTGQRILSRVGRGKRRPTYKVNLALLRVRCPDLFDGRDQLGKVLETRVIVGNRIERKVDGIYEQLEELQATLTRLVRHR